MPCRHATRSVDISLLDGVAVDGSYMVRTSDVVSVTIDLTTESGRRTALERMLTIREFDDVVGKRFSDGEIPGFVHLYIGQEAVAVGAAGALNDDDYITSTHRGHGHCIASGLDTDRMMAEIYGRVDGYCNGKGGSMHIADVDAGMLGANGIVGGGPPIATGAALTATRDNESQVALSFIGDAAIAEGPVHESINMAAVWDLPVIYLIENNQYGEGIPVEKQYNIEDLSDIADAYGLPGVTIDGMDVSAVYEAVSQARDTAENGEPVILEAKTYRYRGHFVGDPEVYRDDDEIDEWRRRDPIESFKHELIERNELTDTEFESLRQSVADQIEASVQYAKDSPIPDPNAAYTDIFSDSPPEITRFTGVDIGSQIESNSSLPDSTDTEELSMREAIRSALREELQRDEDVFLLGEDVGEYGGVFQVTAGLHDEFGDDQLRDTPLSEAAIAGVGVGAAATGNRPVAEIMFSDFLGLSMEPLSNQAAKMRYMFGGKIDMPLTIRTTEGGGMQAASQHSGTVHTWIAHAPGLKAVAPGTPAAAKGLLKASIRSDDPIVFFENKAMYEMKGDIPTDPDFTIPIGRAAIERSGSDLTIVATQRLVSEAVSVADQLADNVDIEVIDLRSLYPLDTDTIRESLEKTNHLVVADESPLSYGIHAELSARMMESAFFNLEAPVQRVGVPDTPIPFSAELETEILPDNSDIEAAVHEIL